MMIAIRNGERDRDSDADSRRNPENRVLASGLEDEP
jgi:hypothetical protein